MRIFLAVVFGALIVAGTAEARSVTPACPVGPNCLVPPTSAAECPNGICKSSPADCGSSSCRSECGVGSGCLQAAAPNACPVQPCRDECPGGPGCLHKPESKACSGPKCARHLPEAISTTCTGQGCAPPPVANRCPHSCRDVGDEECGSSNCLGECGGSGCVHQPLAEPCGTPRCAKPHTTAMWKRCNGGVCALECPGGSNCYLPPVLDEDCGTSGCLGQLPAPCGTGNCRSECTSRACVVYSAEACQGPNCFQSALGNDCNGSNCAAPPLTATLTECVGVGCLPRPVANRCPTSGCVGQLAECGHPNCRSECGSPRCTTHSVRSAHSTAASTKCVGSACAPPPVANGCPNPGCRA
jgi:hypothetical protein